MLHSNKLWSLYRYISCMRIYIPLSSSKHSYSVIIRFTVSPFPSGAFLVITTVAGLEDIS